MTVQPWPTGHLGLRVPAVLRHPEEQRYIREARVAAVDAGLVGGADFRRFERFVVLDALMYSYAPYDRLVRAGSYNQWLFFLDDQYDDDARVASDRSRVRALIDASYRAMADGVIPSAPTPFQRFTLTVAANLRDGRSPAYWERFLGHLRAYHAGTLRALELWNNNEILTPEAHRAVRRQDSSMDSVVDVVEVALDWELTPTDLADGAISTLRACAAEHVALLNDLVSYHKEVVLAGSTFNHLLSVAHHRTEGSIARAVEVLVADLNALVDRFEAAAEGLGGPYAAYAEALRRMIVGNYRFSFHSGRYHHPEAHLAELRAPASDTPPPVDLQPERDRPETRAHGR